MTPTTPWSGPTMVTLVDGQVVLSDAEAWRHETEARDLLSLPLEQRIARMTRIGEKRGAAAVERLIATFATLQGAAACP